MKFSITIPDEHVPFIEAAREERNASLPQTIMIPALVPVLDEHGQKIGEEEGEQEVPNPDLLYTAAAYVQFVMENAARSYAQQHGSK